MANRLRRLLFGAPHIARVASLPHAPAWLGRFFGGAVPARGSVAELLRAGRLPAPQPLSAPPANSVFVLIPNPDHDAAPQLDFARGVGNEVRAVYVEETPDRTLRLLTAWANSGAGVPLLVLPGDGLPVAASLRAYVDLLARDRAGGAVALVLPVCESGACRAKIRWVLTGIAARLWFAGRPEIRVYGGGLSPARSGRELARCAAEA